MGEKINRKIRCMEEAKCRGRNNERKRWLREENCTSGCKRRKPGTKMENERQRKKER